MTEEQKKEVVNYLRHVLKIQIDALYRRENLLRNTSSCIAMLDMLKQVNITNVPYENILKAHSNYFGSISSAKWCTVSKLNYCQILVNVLTSHVYNSDLEKFIPMASLYSFGI
jgi:hypothetical protein